MSHRRAAPFLLAAVLVLTGCARTGGDVAAPSPTSAEDATPTPAGPSDVPSPSPAPSPRPSPTPSPSSEPSPDPDPPPPAIAPAPVLLGETPVRLPDDPGAALEVAVDLGLGAPTEDTGWLEPFNGYGTCPGELRVLAWRAPEEPFAAWLQAMFLRDDASAAPRLAAVHADAASPPGRAPVFLGGVAVGDTLEGLLVAHPDAEVYQDEVVEQWAAFDPDPETGISAFLTGPGPDARVLTVSVPRYPCGD